MSLSFGGFNSQPPEGGCISPLCKTGHAPSFNSQPPEGGCSLSPNSPAANQRFNSQPPEGGCFQSCARRYPHTCVSTHSRPKAAAFASATGKVTDESFNSQPPEGGCAMVAAVCRWVCGFNSQPPEGGCTSQRCGKRHRWFQLTAARRRLRHWS